jgi:hypothetical protein
VLIIYAYMLQFYNIYSYLVVSVLYKITPEDGYQIAETCSV